MKLLLTIRSALSRWIHGDPLPMTPPPAPVDTSQYITTMQVFRAMGITPTNEQSWAVGIRAQAAWATEHGYQPPKDNRTKTSGKGVHCFALYPPEWRPRIESIIRSVTKEASRQQDDLFTR